MEPTCSEKGGAEPESWIDATLLHMTWPLRLCSITSTAFFEAVMGLPRFKETRNGFCLLLGGGKILEGRVRSDRMQ